MASILPPSSVIPKNIANPITTVYKILCMIRSIRLLLVCSLFLAMTAARIARNIAIMPDVISGTNMMGATANTADAAMNVIDATDMANAADT